MSADAPAPAPTPSPRPSLARRARALAIRALAWLAPSAVVAAVAALIAGLVEGALTAHGPLQLVATTGFGALLVIPIGFAGAVIVRGVWAAWRPHRLAAVVVDARGAAPRVAAWAIYLLLAAIFLSSMTSIGVGLLSLFTKFTVRVVAVAMPLFVLTAAGIAAALSRPLVDAIAAGLAWWERRRAARGRRALVTPRLTLAAVIAIGVIAVAVSWLVWIHRAIGPFDLGIFVDPAVAVAAMAGLHALWRRAPRAHYPLAITAGAAAIGVTLAVVILRATSPALVLDVWSRPTVAGFALDELYDLDDIRSEMAMSAFKPVERTTAHPDIILVTIDTVRADRTPLSGGPAHMPVLEKLGAQGAVFDWAFSPGNVTRRSIPSIVLGISPTRVHGRVAGWALRLDPRHVVLAERLRAAGYDTAAFVCCDSFWNAEHKLGINRGIDHLHIEFPGDALSKAARAWIEARDRTHPKKPLFMWVHFIEVHNWNGDNANPVIDEGKRRQYDAVLGQVDHFLGELLLGFAERPPAAQPIVVVTADHGEGLGDHGTPYHSTDLYDSQTHVPLVFEGPGVHARHIGEPVQLVDLAPTLLDLAGYVPPGMPDMDGHSITDLVTGKRAGDPDGGYAFMAQVADRSVTNSERAIVVGRWKLHDMGTHYELYDLRLDPNELHDLAGENASQVARMKGFLDARAAIDDVSPFP